MLCSFRLGSFSEERQNNFDKVNDLMWMDTKSVSIHIKSFVGRVSFILYNEWLYTNAIWMFLYLMAWLGWNTAVQNNGRKKTPTIQ